MVDMLVTNTWVRILGMELFVLVIWLWAGQRFEEARIENMGRGESSSG